MFFIISAQSSAKEIWIITSLDWPPFSGKELPGGGVGITVLRRALNAEGIELEVKFLPWSRAIVTAGDPTYLGVFPSWHEEVRAGFSKSIVIFSSPVGFVEPRDKPLAWKKLTDLKGKLIGVVQDYGNTVEFNSLVKNKMIRTEIVQNDLDNIRKVALKRIDGAFIDLSNLDYLLKNDGKKFASKVQANSKVIKNKDLVLAINNKFANKNVDLILKKGMAKINTARIIQDYNTKYLK